MGTFDCGNVSQASMCKSVLSASQKASLHRSLVDVVDVVGVVSVVGVDVVDGRVPSDALALELLVSAASPEEASACVDCFVEICITPNSVTSIEESNRSQSRKH